MRSCGTGAVSCGSSARTPFKRKPAETINPDQARENPIAVLTGRNINRMLHVAQETSRKQAEPGALETVTVVGQPSRLLDRASRPRTTTRAGRPKKQARRLPHYHRLLANARCHTFLRIPALCRRGKFGRVGAHLC